MIMDETSGTNQAAVAAFRQCVVDNASQLVADRIGPHSNRDVYLEITEGRDSTESMKYGWCGDFVTYVYFLAHCHNGRALNRASLNHGVWQPQVNITRLQQFAKANGGWADITELRQDPSLLQPGDAVIFSRKDGNHIGIFKKWTATGEFLSLDGNSWGGVCATNPRALVSQGETLPVLGRVSVECLVANLAVDAVHDGLSASELTPEVVAISGDSSELFGLV